MLYVNGDSFTYGTGVDSKDTWPSLLAEKLDLNLVNDAVPGGSNARVIRTTLAFLARHQPSLVVIAWSSFLRTEWPSHGLEPQHLHEMDFGHSPIIQVQPNYTKYRNNDLPAITQYYQNINTNWAIDNYINQVLLLQSYLKYSKIQYVFMNALDNYDADVYRSSNKVKLVTEEFLGWPNQCFNQWFRKDQRLPDGHLNTDGHRVLAEKLYNHVKDIRT